MAIRDWTFHRSAVVRILAAGAVVAGAFACVTLGRSVAAPGEWITLSGQKVGVPVRNKHLHQQPRPASAPTAPDGHAVELTGTIESCQPPRQPRPLSAAPRRLDLLVSSLAPAHR